MACAAIHVDTSINVAQAVVRRNQKCLDSDGNHFELQKSNVTCIHLCYQYILSITILIQFFRFLKCVYIFLAPSVCIYIYIYTHTQTHTPLLS